MARPKKKILTSTYFPGIPVSKQDENPPNESNIYKNYLKMVEKEFGYNISPKHHKVVSDIEYVEKLMEHLDFPEPWTDFPYEDADIISSLVDILVGFPPLYSTCLQALLCMSNQPHNTTVLRPKLWGIYRVTCYSGDGVCFNAPAVFVPNFPNLYGGYLFWPDDKSAVYFAGSDPAQPEKKSCFVVSPGHENWSLKFMAVPGDFTPFDIPLPIRTLLINLRTYGRSVSKNILAGGLGTRKMLYSLQDIYNDQKKASRSLRRFSNYFGSCELPPQMLIRRTGKVVHVVSNMSMALRGRYSFLLKFVPDGKYTIGKKLAEKIIPHISTIIKYGRQFDSSAFLVSESQEKATKLFYQYAKKIPITGYELQALRNLHSSSPYPRISEVETEGRSVEESENGPSLNEVEPVIVPAPAPVLEDGNTVGGQGDLEIESEWEDEEPDYDDAEEEVEEDVEEEYVNHG